MELKDHLIRKNPALKSFLRNNSKTVTECAVVAFSKISNNDGHTSSLHEEFRTICKTSGNLKRSQIFLKVRKEIMSKDC